MPTPLPFATKTLAAEPDATAPDGTSVRLLPALAGGSLAHFELPAGAVSHAVTHRTVEEIWYVVAGRGVLWRRAGAEDRPFAFVAVTMPPWPGEGEAEAVEGKWRPTAG
jgi:mannose-6-phosphate isomerase-like protein (cupin superfamily)